MSHLRLVSFETKFSLDCLTFVRMNPDNKMPLQRAKTSLKSWARTSVMDPSDQDTKGEKKKEEEEGEKRKEKEEGGQERGGRWGEWIGEQDGTCTAIFFWGIKIHLTLSQWKPHLDESCQRGWKLINMGTAGKRLSTSSSMTSGASVWESPEWPVTAGVGGPENNTDVTFN